MKKILALVIAIMMVMAMGSVAFAASITIKSTADEGTTDETAYSAWMLLNADIGEAPTQDDAEQTGGKVAYYTTSSTAKAALEDAGLFTFTEVVGSSPTKWYATPKDGLTAAEVTGAFADWTDAQMTAAFGTPYTGAQTEAGGSAEITCGDDGYYFVKSTLGDQIVVQTIGDVTINTKNSYPTHDKEVDSTDENAQIGDEITYTLTVNIPATANDVLVLTDVMDEGLTFKSIDDTFSSSVAYTFAPEKTAAAVTANNNTFTLTIDADVVKANQGATLTINYIAVLNNKAVVGTTTNNELILDYGNNFTAVTKEVGTDTHSFSFDKIDGDNNEKLTGAEFILTIDGSTPIDLVEITAGEEYRIWMSEDGEDAKLENATIVTAGKTITIYGVDSDTTYQLVETKEPAGGYNKLEDPETITVAEDNTTHVDIENNKGTVLPSTGGIGTTIFYVIGAMLFVGAGVLLVAKRRASK